MPPRFAESADLDDRRDPTRRGLVGGGVAHQVDVDDEVDGLGDQAPHRELRQVRVRLRHVVGETLQHDVGRVGVDRGERAAFAHRRDVEHVECLVLDQLADDDPVGVEPAGQLDELAGRDLALALGVGMAGEQRRCVGVARVVLEAQLEQVLLDGDDPFERRHLAEQLGEQCRLAGAGWTRHEHRESAPHERAQLGDELDREQAESGETVETDLAHDETADRDPRMGRDAVLAVAAEHHHDARAVVGLHRQHRRRRVETTLAGAAHPERQPLLERGQFGGRLPQRADVDLASVGIGDPRRRRRVDVDLLDRRCR